MGDSVGAHFHFPELWMDPLQVAQIDPETIPQVFFNNVTQWILNEGDWPQLGFATGFQNNTQPSLIQVFRNQNVVSLNFKSITPLF
jgi:hypothetical protein